MEHHHTGEQDTPPVDEMFITPSAIAEIQKIMEANNIPATRALRLGIKGGGCSGVTYVIGFDDKRGETDRELEFDGMRVLIDPKSFLYLAGTTLDYAEGVHGKGFVFDNPNSCPSCGCGDSSCC